MKAVALGSGESISIKGTDDSSASGGTPDVLSVAGEGSLAGTEQQLGQVGVAGFAEDGARVGEAIHDSDDPFPTEGSMGTDIPQVHIGNGLAAAALYANMSQPEGAQLSPEVEAPTEDDAQIPPEVYYS